MEEKLHNLRHSLAHLMAAAVLKLWPDTKPTIGPVIENGFYYDFEFAEKISDMDLAKIEKEMRKLLPTWSSFERQEVTATEAKKIFAGNPFKLELIEELAKGGETITLYKSGEFVDLCRGGHVDDPAKEIDPQAFKLDRLAGAYWRGDEKNSMLTRIYGLGFGTKQELADYEHIVEEAKKRDHKKLGRELDLFVFSELVGPGLPLYTFKGTIVRNEIANYSNELQNEIGYQIVHTPNMNKAELFKVSGHYEKYKDDMFKVVSNYTKEEYFLKPMNCPQHTQIYAAKMRSYKDLPIRIADFANLYRDEKPGELSGLTRLRAFSQDDGHCFCREDQIKDEFLAVLGIVKKALQTYGMDYYIRLSLWDPKHREKFLGEPETWEKSQKLLEEILKENKIEYVVGIGEAAIYGPKMDIITKDSLGREWQISTIQLDFIMPQRFGLAYTDKDGSEKTPVMIHRAIVGSPERFMGILIEHYAGAFPTWLSPVQTIVLPISDKHLEYAQKLITELKEKGIRVDLDDRNESVGKKIREAELQKIPYMLVVGDKEAADNTVTIRKRGEKDQQTLTTADFIAKITEEIKNKNLN